MGIESIVNVVVTASTATITQAGFGTPLILGTTPRAGSDLVRYYSTATAVSADYAVTTPEYKMATRIFLQATRPQRIAIAKRTHLPTQVITFTPVVASATRYAWDVDGVVVEYTSDADATGLEITAGLVAAWTAITGTKPAVTVTDVGPGTSVRQTSAVGAWHSVRSLTPDVLKVEDTSADGGVTDDLVAIFAAQKDWYGILTPFTSAAEVLEIAEWTEANRKLFFYATSDSAVRDTTYDPDDADANIGASLRSRNYFRTLGIFQGGTGDFADAAFMGVLLSKSPGSVTMHLKRAVGIPALVLEDNELNNLKSYNINPYVVMEGLSVMLNGTVAAGEFVDITRDTDWHVARTRERVFARMVELDKVPYTDAGVSILTAETAAQAQVAETAGFIKPGWTVTSVPVDQVAPADRAARRYPDIVETAEYQGAIHIVDPLTIRLSV